MPRIIRSCDASIEWMGGRFVGRLLIGRWYETEAEEWRKVRDKSRPFARYLDALRWMAPWGATNPTLVNCWRREDWRGAPYTICLGREGQRVMLRAAADHPAPYDGVYAVAYPGHDLELSNKVAHPLITRHILEIYDASEPIVQALKREIACRELPGLVTA